MSVPERVATGRPVRRVRLFGERFSRLVDLRTLAVCAALPAVIAAVTVVAVSRGELPIPIPDVVRAFAGTADSFTTTVVTGWRLPRALVAVLLGAALGLAGAIFQSLTRNPLGSPDVVGFDTGSYAGALIVIVALGGTGPVVGAGAIAGGVVTALAVYLLAFKRGVQGFRLIIVGLSLSALLSTFCTYLVMRAELPLAMAAAFWGAGSLNDANWATAGWSALWLGAVLLLVLPLSRSLAMLELGDEAAAGRGVRVEPARLALMLLGVLCSAMVVTLAGPISFVSLVAPQLAVRLVRTAGPALTASAFTGGALLAASDLVARVGPAGEVPVGTVTVVFGGLYLIWLLVREGRRRR